MACADVTSANVVGYSTIKIESQYQIIGVNFLNVDGGELALNDAIPYQDGMTKGNGVGTADQIQIGDTEGSWVPYYLSNGLNNKGKVVTPSIDGLWCKGGEYVKSTVTLKAGDSFWYIRKDATKPAFNISIAGSVSTLPEADYQFASKYRIFSNPYAAPLSLNDNFVYDEKTMTKGNGVGTADQIQIGDTEGSWVPYYLSNGLNNKGKVVTPSIDGLWCKGGEYVNANASIPVGKAAWYVRKDETKDPIQVKFVRPYDL